MFAHQRDYDFLRHEYGDQLPQGASTERDEVLHVPGKLTARLQSTFCLFCLLRCQLLVFVYLCWQYFFSCFECLVASIMVNCRRIFCGTVDVGCFLSACRAPKNPLGKLNPLFSTTLYCAYIEKCCVLYLFCILRDLGQNSLYSNLLNNNLAITCLRS